MLIHHGQEAGIKIARKHLGWYSKGLHGSSEFRVKINQAEAYEQVKTQIHQFYDSLIEG